MNRRIWEKEKEIQGSFDWLSLSLKFIVSFKVLSQTVKFYNQAFFLGYGLCPRKGLLDDRISWKKWQTIYNFIFHFVSGHLFLLVHLQAESIRASLSGKNVVVATSTSSGKSLCYNLPVLEVLSENLLSCALYLFPTKVHGKKIHNKYIYIYFFIYFNFSPWYDVCDLFFLKLLVLICRCGICVKDLNRL